MDCLHTVLRLLPALLYVISSEPGKIDSITHAINLAETDTAKAKLLFELCDEYYPSDMEKYHVFAQEGLALAKKQQFKKGISAGQNNLGIYYFSKSDYTQAIIYFLESSELNRQLGHKKEVARNLNNVAIAYRIQGDYKLALNYFQKARDLREQLGDKELIAYSVNSIGGVFYLKGEYEKSMDYYLKALALNEELKNEYGIADGYTNIGGIYYAQKKFEEALEFYLKALKTQQALGNKREASALQNNLGVINRNLGNKEKALEYYSQSLEIKRELKDKTGVATALNNMGVVYQEQEDYRQAINYFQDAMQLREELGDKNGIAMGLANIGSSYNKMGNADQAISYCRKSLVIAKQIGSLELLKANYKTLANSFAGKHKYELAYQYHELYSSMSDSLLNEKSSRQMTEMAAKYESDKKQRELEIKDLKIARQELELNQGKIIKYALALGVALLLMLSFVIYNRYRLKRKSNEQITDAYHIIAEKNKNITDSIDCALKIQEAILPPKEIKFKLFPNAFVMLLPKDVVSGDFYWFGEKNGKKLIAAVDCTGHGVPGAFMSMVGNAFLNDIVMEKDITKPSEILNMMREQVIKSLKQKGETGEQQDGMDMGLCCFNSNDTVEFSGAHNPLYHIRNGKLTTYKGDRQPIAYHIRKPKPFSNHRIELQKGDTVYIMSDGYADQFGGKSGKKFKYGKLKELLLSMQDLPMPAQEEILQKSFDDWKGAHEQTDDVCVIGVRV